MGTELDTELADALKNRAYHLGKNLKDLTPGQIAEVEANPRAYLPEGYFTKVETPEEEAEAPEEEPTAETEAEPPAKPKRERRPKERK